ncbi:hypothetical protein F5Y08DRAFT_338690 [Xylaria arbuscula]|nr:hypothetical protein F5Y08DRAFT_338690 [Xylaria arbuscula]
MTNYYKVLGISRNASRADIEAAYISRCDILGSPLDAHIGVRKFKIAYEILSDKPWRRWHNHNLELRELTQRAYSWMLVAGAVQAVEHRRTEEIEGMIKNYYHVAVEAQTVAELQLINTARSIGISDEDMDAYRERFWPRVTAYKTRMWDLMCLYMEAYRLRRQAEVEAFIEEEFEKGPRLRRRRSV